jgi:hypothetical protein
MSEGNNVICDMHTVNTQSKSNFLVYTVPPYIFICTLGAIWLIIDGWVSNFSSISFLWSVEKGKYLPPIAISLLFTQAGAILGGSLLAVVSFHKYKAIKKTFDNDHLWGFLFSPLLALTIGTLAFAIIQSGLIVLSGGVDMTKNPYTSTLGYLSIGGIAGYNWDVFIKKLQDLSKNVINAENTPVDFRSDSSNN